MSSKLFILQLCLLLLSYAWAAPVESTAVGVEEQTPENDLTIEINSEANKEEQEPLIIGGVEKCSTEEVADGCSCSSTPEPDESCGDSNTDELGVDTTEEENEKSE